LQKRHRKGTSWGELNGVHGGGRVRKEECVVKRTGESKGENGELEKEGGGI